MTLSQQERQRLREIEAALCADSPNLARRMRAFAVARSPHAPGLCAAGRTNADGPTARRILAVALMVVVMLLTIGELCPSGASAGSCGSVSASLGSGVKVPCSAPACPGPDCVL
jgi:hypothetical protein